MYCTTPSGTRYQTGIPRATRSRQSVELIASAGTSTRLTAPSGRWRVGEVEPGPGHADEVGQVEQLLVVPPADDLGERVGAGDEEQLGVRALPAQVAQRVDGVRRAAAVDVDAADREARVGGGGDHRHQVAVLGRADLALALLPRLAGRHEHDLVETEQAGDLAGGHQVPVVDGIERPAHDPDPAACHRASLTGRPTGVREDRGQPRGDRPRPVGPRAPPEGGNTRTRDRLPRAAGRGTARPSRTIRGTDAGWRTGIALTNARRPVRLRPGLGTPA